MNRFAKYRVVIYGLVFLGLFLLARIPAWHSHMQVDIWVFWLRISSYVENNSFGLMSGNEVLPATLLYLFTPLLLIPQGWLSYSTYMPAMMLINFFVLIATFALAKDKKVILMLLVALGPILIFRFDGLVALLLVAALLLFENKRIFTSGVLMGLAIGMKVYPVLIVPYLGLILAKNQRYREILLMTVAILISILVPVVIFWWLGGTVEQVKYALSFHNNKLISIESVVGSIITAKKLWLTGTPPELLPGNGIWSVEGPVALFNRFWAIPVAGLYIMAIWSGKLLNKLNWMFVISIVLTFLVFSKNLNPQYMWWYLVFVPFVERKWTLIGLSIGAAVANQIVYPLYYTTFIEEFYRQNQLHWIFYTLALRNSLIIMSMLLCYYEIIKNELKNKIS